LTWILWLSVLAKVHVSHFEILRRIYDVLLTLAVVDMGHCMVRELDSGRVGSHPVMVDRRAADTGFGRRRLVLDVVADIAGIAGNPAAGSLLADSFLGVVRSLVLALATRIDWEDIGCTAGRIGCRDQTWWRTVVLKVLGMTIWR
jgi:hypothetical protein